MADHCLWRAARNLLHSAAKLYAFRSHCPPRLRPDKRHWQCRTCRDIHARRLRSRRNLRPAASCR
ncbi:MAG TPA: hypothetical protein DDZ43_11765, partial [Hyphomonadaceae bacterium]|nr:hypothetical protein [Hyphomonadaceae bacterium]